MHVDTTPCVLDQYNLTVLLQEFHPVDDGTIKVYGRKLNLGADKNDYEITIGAAGYCVVTDLSVNQVVCKPPEKAPEPDEKNSKPHNGKATPHMKVCYA